MQRLQARRRLRDELQCLIELESPCQPPPQLLAARRLIDHPKGIALGVDVEKSAEMRVMDVLVPFHERAERAERVRVFEGARPRLPYLYRIAALAFDGRID